eukprot:985464-Prymnesium_polylepis.1
MNGNAFSEGDGSSGALTSAVVRRPEARDRLLEAADGGGLGVRLRLGQLEHVELRVRHCDRAHTDGPGQ